MKKVLSHLIQFLFRDIPIHIIQLLTSLLPNHYAINRLRGALIRPFIKKCGRRFQCGRGVILNNPGLMYIGDDCYFSHYIYVQAKGNLYIGDNVIIGPMSVLATSNHIIADGIVQNKGVSRPISIGEGTFVGSHSIIMSGVTIGEHAVIGAGSAVTKDVPANIFVAGIPCTIVKESSPK